MKNLSDKIQFKSYQKDKPSELTLTKEMQWVKTLILEMTEASLLSEEDKLKNSTLACSLGISKDAYANVDDLLLIAGDFHLTYDTVCINSLKPLRETLIFSIKLCFMHESYSSDDAYKEETDVFIKNQMYELYFGAKGAANIGEAIHEQVFLNYNFYPQIEESE